MKDINLKYIKIKRCTNQVTHSAISYYVSITDTEAFPNPSEHQPVWCFHPSGQYTVCTGCDFGSKTLTCYLHEDASVLKHSLLVNGYCYKQL